MTLHVSSQCAGSGVRVGLVLTELRESMQTPNDEPRLDSAPLVQILCGGTAFPHSTLIPLDA